jgi:hypothetical protein
MLMFGAVLSAPHMLPGIGLSVCRQRQPKMPFRTTEPPHVFATLSFFAENADRFLFSLSGTRVTSNPEVPIRDDRTHEI